MSFQNGCSKMLKGEMRQSRVNMTVQHYHRIFCSNMMKSNQEVFKDGFTGQTQDIFVENSGFTLYIYIYIYS